MKPLRSESPGTTVTKLFEVRRLSIGKAAEVAGLPKLRFIDELRRLGVPVINLGDDQIGDELRDD